MSRDRRTYTTAAPKIDTPDWLPAPVRRWLAENSEHPDHAEYRATIDRIAGDERLRQLWAELARRKPDGAFVYPPRPEALEHLRAPGSADDDRQAVALIALFKQFLHAATTPYPAQNKKGARAKREDYLRRAEFLTAEAADCDRMPTGAGGVDWAIVAGGMRAKADVLLQAAAAVQGVTATVQNARTNATGLQTASRISSIFQALYGTRMANQAAIVAEVLTGEAVTKEQVRDLNRKAPGCVKFLPRRPEKSHRETSEGHDSK